MDISAAEFSTRYKEPDRFIIIDVREELEFQTFNLGGVNIPLSLLLKEIDDLGFDKSHEIVVICQRGLRSATAKQALAQYGYMNVRNLTGGLLSLQKLKTNSSKQ
ncbi:MAG: rhodanese-like domain-containing protein [Daejeonella sp.]|uniref:rhodanese-like domain-containing protein n=1 Tax=Daejeonella sp. JGW-45 TaxID=3034148 RepID=UPI0023EC3F91|nr:rhodanese-like domain-containing protein [Daejeonella sp. JGW-45]